MPKNTRQVPGSLRQLWQRLKRQWITVVPDDIAVCEFDCRKGQCLYDEWDSCERRISKAAGELMPPTPPGSPPGKT
jgi:hypothetical protein